MAWYAGAFPTGEIIFGQSTSDQAYGQANPGVYVAVGPFATEQAAEQWVNAHASTWPPPPPKQPRQPAGGSGGKNGGKSGSGAPAPAPAGKWYIEYVVAGGGSGGEAVPKVVQAATPPQSGGNIEWVFGPYNSKAAALAAAATGPPPPSKMVNSRGLTDNSSAAPGQSLNVVPGLSDFFTKLGDRATWVRILKVVVGSIMIIAGLVRLGAPGAEQVASKLPKVIPV